MCLHIHWANVFTYSLASKTPCDHLINLYSLIYVVLLFVASYLDSYSYYYNYNYLNIKY